MQPPLPSLASLSTALLRNAPSLQTEDHTDLAHIFKTLSVGMLADAGPSSEAGGAGQSQLVPHRPPHLYPHTTNPHDGAHGVTPEEAPKKDPLRTAMLLFAWDEVFDANQKTLKLPPLTETQLESITISGPENDKYKYRVFAVRTDTVPWKESLKLPSDQQRCIIIWRQLFPDTGSQTQLQTQSKKAKMVEESASFEPWMMITESAALKQIRVPKTPNGVDTHGLYMLKDLKPYFDKRRNAHSVSKEILGYYSGIVRYTWPTDHNLSDADEVKQTFKDRVRPHGSKDLFLYYKDRTELVDSGTHELPPFLSFANDPLFTGQRANAAMSKTGVLTTWSEGVGGGKIRYPKAFDFEKKSLAENVESEILWEYDGSSYWDGGPSYWQGVFEEQGRNYRKELREYKKQHPDPDSSSDEDEESEGNDDSDDEDFKGSSAAAASNQGARRQSGRQRRPSR